ncbi:hypothetical protein BMS3Bbin10_01588 [bacterium BMS3Bbin10]|nr:hypothetical protein BMS3Bbin10_01588 [bacterium BMS3Bbin10]
MQALKVAPERGERDLRALAAGDEGVEMAQRFARAPLGRRGGKRIDDARAHIADDRIDIPDMGLAPRPGIGRQLGAFRARRSRIASKTACEIAARLAGNAHIVRAEFAIDQRSHVPRRVGVAGERRRPLAGLEYLAQLRAGAQIAGLYDERGGEGPGNQFRDGFGFQPLLRADEDDAPLGEHGTGLQLDRQPARVL